MVLRIADALGRTPRLRGRAAGGERGRGSGDQVGDVQGLRRKRLRAVRAPSAGCTGSCAPRRSTPPTAVRRARGRRGRAGGQGHRRDRDQRATTCRWTPTARRAPAASTSTRRTRPCASPTARRASSCSARTSARSPQPRDRDGDAAREARRARAQRQEDIVLEKGMRRTSTSARRSAPTRRTRTRWPRITAPGMRWATSNACSTAIWMDSCVRTCSPARRRGN